MKVRQRCDYCDAYLVGHKVGVVKPPPYGAVDLGITRELLWVACPSCATDYGYYEFSERRKPLSLSKTPIVNGNCGGGSRSTYYISTYRPSAVVVDNVDSMEEHIYEVYMDSWNLGV